MVTFELDAPPELKQRCPRQAGQGLLLALTMAGLIAAEAAASQRDLVPVQLRCEYVESPLGVDTAQPRLFWNLESSLRAQRQTAYQVTVASSFEALRKEQADLWDSAKVNSSEQGHIEYAGTPLRSSQACWWKVRIWDGKDRVSAWSQPASWTMGLLKPSDWSARWITGEPKGPLPLFRREFQVSKKLTRALVRVCGLGFYELHLNGRKVGDQVLDPGWTNYRKTCLYASYEVTKQLRAGDNCVGLMLGNGMYNVTGGRYVKYTGTFGPPKAILQLELQYADGSSERVVTDDQWRTAPGPIVFSCIYGGEDYDARKEQAGWDRPSFEATGWSAAQCVEGPGGSLKAQTAPPSKVMKIYEPVKITEPKPGIYVYDLGQNFSGWPSLQVEGAAGQTVKLIPGELLEPNGLVSQRSSGGPVSFSYTLKGVGVESWHPKFSYYGFRYVQVEGAVPKSLAQQPGKPVLTKLAGEFVHSSAVMAGRFTCSNELLNRIHDLIDRAIESNLQSVLTDCPHREKLGWLEVSHLLGPAIAFNYDVATLYAKICADMEASQLPNGLVPDIAPEYTVFSGGFRDSPEWGSASVINPWLLYQRYGDRRVLSDHYDMMARYVAYLGSSAKGGIVEQGLGDWYDIGPRGPGEFQLTTKGLTSTAIWYHDLTILEQTAKLLGKTEDSAKYEQLARQVRETFNRRFFHADSNQYDRGSQTANAMPLVFGMVDPEKRAAVLENIVRDVESRGNQVTAGDVGFRYLMMALAQGGRSDVLYRMNTRTNPPSYGSQLARGATALTEAWDANPASSQNHCMLGHAEEWFYTDVAGIQPDPERPGFEHVIMRPQPVGDLTSAEASYHSVRGLIRCRWQKQGNQFRLGIELPPNTTGTIYVPTQIGETMREGNRSLDRAEGVLFRRQEGGCAVLDVGSGRYQFTAELR